MKYFFEDEQKQAELMKILREWLGTPWRHHCGVKGLGCDCIHFVARVLEELKIVRWRKDLIPDYPRDWHKHNTREILKEALEKEIRGEWVMYEGKWTEPAGFRNGDIILAHYGRACSHAMIFADDHIYHAIDGASVLRTPVSETRFRRRMRFVYRVLA